MKFDILVIMTGHNCAHIRSTVRLFKMHLLFNFCTDSYKPRRVRENPKEDSINTRTKLTNEFETCGSMILPT